MRNKLNSGFGITYYTGEYINFNKTLTYMIRTYKILFVYLNIRTRDMKIKEYYTSEFPTDELGIEIDPTATFDGLIEVLINYESVYDYIGVADSVVRERVFEKLSDILGVGYEVIYDKWLMKFSIVKAFTGEL